VGWLDAYLLRSDRRGYVMDPTEADDFIALDAFLRGQDVPLLIAAAA
jgi:hypothetical protein